MPGTVSPTDLTINLALWRQKKPLDVCPVFDGTMSSTTALAKRNTSGTARPSLLLVKSLLGVLMGNVAPALADAERVLVKVASMSGGGSTEAALNWKTNTWVCLYGSTYHIGILALVEALIHAPLAQDFCAAWTDLLDLFTGKLPLSTDNLQSVRTEDAFQEAVIRAADELYYWMRYRDLSVDPTHDRIDGVTVDKQWPKASWVSPTDLTPLLLDAVAIRSKAKGTPAVAPISPVAPSTVPTPKGQFKGPQKAILLRAIQDRVPTLLFGQTASGKNTCFNEVVGELGLGFEAVGGKEGLADLDFFGSLTKTKRGLAWVDGPIARAMRRAATEPIVVWLDEFTRIRPEQVNILVDLLNEVPEALMLKSGAKLWGASAHGLYRRVEVPQCAEVFNCPAENLILVAACNRGRAYAAYDIDPALMRRFPRKIEFRYLDAASETQLLIEKSSAPLDPKIALACVGVATKVRQMAETAEVASPLDPGSLIYWASQVAARMQAESLKWSGSSASTKSTLKTQVIAIAQSEAETTWMPAVVAPDLNGVLPIGKLTALKDVVRDQFNANL